MTQLMNQLINDEGVCRAVPGFARVCKLFIVGYTAPTVYYSCIFYCLIIIKSQRIYGGYSREASVFN